MSYRARDVHLHRLATQGLLHPFDTPADAVAQLTCVQSQEREHAFFSLGLRLRGATMRSVRESFDRGEFLRTHILRPTWHFVRPEDLRWILDLTSARVEPSMAARHRELGLDAEPRVARALDTLARLLQGRQYRSRAQLGALAHRDLPPAGPHLGHLLMIAELRGLICSGPISGVQHTYALVDEVVPAQPRLDDAEALRRLVHRFYAGHGPASVADFVRWSSLTGAQTRRALDELGPAVERLEVDGQELWHVPADVPPRSVRSRAWLLPIYDEVTLTYPRLQFPLAGQHPHGARHDTFETSVVYGTTNVGTWKRTIAREAVEVQVRLAPSVGEGARRAVQAAARRLAAFLERPLDYHER